MAGRRPQGSRHHARPLLGACRCRTATSGRAMRGRSSTSGSMRPSATSPRPGNGRTRPAAIGKAGGARTRARKTCAMSSSWGRTTFLPHRRLSGHALRVRADGGERWKVVDYIKGFNWINYYGGQVLDVAEARHLHGCGARNSAGGLLALVPDVERARKDRTPPSPGRISNRW